MRYATVTVNLSDTFATIRSLHNGPTAAHRFARHHKANHVATIAPTAKIGDRIAIVRDASTGLVVQKSA